MASFEIKLKVVQSLCCNFPYFIRNPSKSKHQYCISLLEVIAEVHAIKSGTTSYREQIPGEGASCLFLISYQRNFY